LFAQRALREQVAVVNSAIYRAAEDQSRFGGMGTTLVAAVFCDDRLVVAHIGDSRLYRLRGEEFVALTHDHSLLQEQLDRGEISAEEARYSVNRNLVTRAVGVDPQVEAEVHVRTPFAPATFTCCVRTASTTCLKRVRLSTCWRRAAPILNACCKQLIQLANDNGGDDNISVVVVKVLREFPAAPGRWSKLWSWFK
jgi:serine/threonine protein phosphatase PrpC